MNSNVKRISCLLLCVVLLFCGFADVLTAPADAVGAIPGIGTATMVAVKWILGLAGLSFASAGAAYIAAEGFYNSSPTVKSDVDSIAGSISQDDVRPGMVVTVQSGLIPAIKRLFQSVVDYFATDKDVVSVNAANVGLFGDVKFTDITDFVDDAEAYQYCFYSYSDKPVEILKNGAKCKYYVASTVRDNGNISYNLRVLRGESLDLPICSYVLGLYGGVSTGVGNFDHLIDVRYGFQQILHSDGKTYLRPYMMAAYVNSRGDAVLLREADIAFNQHTWFDLTNENIDAFTVPVFYNRFANIDFQKLIDALAALVDTATGGLTIPVDDIVGQVEDGAKEKEDDIPKPYVPDLEWLRQLLRDLGLTDAQIGELIKEKTDTDNPAIDKEGETDLDVPTLPSLKEKFPFCVPFDLIALISALAAEPVAPRWVFPLDYPSFNFHYDLVFDLTQFDMVAQVIRWGCILGFIYVLIMRTRSLIKA